MSGRVPVFSELSPLLRLAAPLTLLQLGQSIAAVSEVVVAGRIAPSALDGLAVSSSLFQPLSVLASGLVLGIEPLVQQSVGAGRPGRARHFVAQSAWIALAAFLGVAACIAAAPRVLPSLGLTPVLAATVARLLWWRLPSLLPLLALSALRTWLQSHARLRPLVIALVTANLITPLACVGLARTPLGPHALALSGGVFAAVQLVCLALLLRRPRLTLVGAVPRPSPASLRQALAIGVPNGLQLAAGSLAFSIVGVLAGRFGAAAHQLTVTLDALAYTVALGVGTAGAIRVGRAIGAGDRAAVRRAGLTAFALAAALMSISGGLFVVFPARIAALLVGDPALVRLASPLVRIAGAFHLLDALLGVGTCLLRATGDTRFSLAAYLTGYYAIGLPLALLLALGAGLGLPGLWLGTYLGLAVVAIALTLRFVRRARAGIVPLDRDLPTRRAA